MVISVRTAGTSAERRTANVLVRNDGTDDDASYGRRGGGNNGDLSVIGARSNPALLTAGDTQALGFGYVRRKANARLASMKKAERDAMGSLVEENDIGSGFGAHHPLRGGGAPLTAAEKARRWGETVEMEPMNAYDRRVVHEALREVSDVSTESIEVEDTNKKMILVRPVSG